MLEIYGSIQSAFRFTNFRPIDQSKMENKRRLQGSLSLDNNV